jgi:ubiquitin C-terminal hydrolase
MLMKRCAAYVRARKQLSIHEAPNILTIVLKRFQVSLAYLSIMAFFLLFVQSTCRKSIMAFFLLFQPAPGIKFTLSVESWYDH